MPLNLAASQPAQAQAQPPAILKWTEVDTPGAKGEVIVTPSEVSRIAVGRGDVIYAIDSANSMVYRSDNGGLTWNNITRSLLAAGAVLPASQIAVAPDRPQNVAVVTNNGTTVYLSADSGASWSNTSVPSLGGATIQCITISKSYSLATDLAYDIAIGTAAWGNATTTGQVWTLQARAVVSAWLNQNVTIVGFNRAEVSAIAFSPNYTSDGTILAIASTAADAGVSANKTYLCIGQRDLYLQTTSWNVPTGYPAPITGAGDAASANITSSIALPSDYVGTDPTSRKVFVSYNRQPDSTNANDVYRLDDVTLYRLNAAAGGTIGISSISYYGTLNSGKLLAGEVNQVPGSRTVQVRRSFNPLVLLPSLPSWQLATEPPSGPGNAQVSWSSRGTAAFCGTGQIPGVALDESAFSRSLNDGDTWEQTSLIDTIIQISDIAPALDSKGLFLATYSPFGGEGVWRSAGELLGNFWGRVLTINTASNRIILRLSPNYITDYTIYVAEVSGSQMAVSHDRGNSWQRRYIPGPVIDIAIENKDTIYVALPNGYVRKSTNGGYIWEATVRAGLFDINTLTVAKKGHLLVGSRDSKVAYSTDGGASFIEIPLAICDNTGDVQVVADADYSRNKIIYAADNVTDSGIWRWAIGLSDEWEQIDESVTRRGMGQRISGLMTGDEGTLYALRSEPVNGAGAGGMTRTLNPFQPYTTQIEFDIVNATLPVGTRFDPLLIFSHTLPYLKLSDGAAQNELWSVGTTANITAIYRFQDNVCKLGPMATPSGEVGCDPVSGRNQGVGLTWEQLSLSDRYELQLAKNDAFSLRLKTVEPASNPFYMPAQVTHPAYYINPGQILECGHIYYWRVRTRHAATSENITSPWAEVRSFTVKAGLPARADYYGIKLLSPDNGCMGCPVQPASFSWSPLKETRKYKFVLARDADMTQVIAEATVPTTAYEYGGALDYSTNYFWQVMALEPASSDWSATFSFQTEPAPEPPPLPAKPTATPLWVWMVIGIGATLAIVILALLIKTE